MCFDRLIWVSFVFALSSCSLDWSRHKLAPDDAGRGDPDADGGGVGMEGGTPVTCLPPACHPCDMKPCADRGVCSEIDTGFECACKIGFSGTTCAVDICELDPCAHGACLRTSTGRTCKCEPNWSGETCDSNGDASLVDLTVSIGTLHPAFKPEVYVYSVDLGISAPELSVTATTAVPGGVTIKVDGLAAKSGVASDLHAMELNTSKEIAIDVTADDGTKLAYRVVVRRSLVQQAYLKRKKPKEQDRLGGGKGGLIPYLGASVALLGDHLFVGSPNAGAGSSAYDAYGEVVRMDRTGVDWAEGASAVGTKQPSSLGLAVTMSERWLVAGAPMEGVPAVYVFDRKVSTLSSPSFVLDPEPVEDANFGHRVAISGNTLAVAAPGQAAVYIFRYDQAWGLALTIAGPVDDPGAFGYDLAIEGDLVAVGAQQRDMNAGAVFVYDISGAEAKQVGYLSHPTLQFMGTAVAISDGRVASASGFQSLDNSKIVIYERVGGTWVAGTPFGPPSGLTVSEELEPEGFAANGLVFQGNRILVGAAYEQHAANGVNGDRQPGAQQSGSGAAYLFVERSNGWHMDAYLKAGTSSAGGSFGMGLAMDGDTLAITEPGDSSGTPPKESDTSVPNSGAIYVFGTNCANVPPGAAVPGC